MIGSHGHHDRDPVLPTAVWCAERIAGSVHRDGDAFLPALALGSVSLRVAAALRTAGIHAESGRTGVILTGLSAAWAYGASRRLPQPIELAVSRERRVRVRAAPALRIREQGFAPGDVRRTLGGCLTSPERTAYDLLCALPEQPWPLAARVAVRLLTREDPGALGSRLGADARRPGSRLARLRWASYAPVTRYTS